MQVDQLRSLALFDGLTDDELAPFASQFEELDIVAGSSLAKQDDFAYKFFVVLDGDVDVHRDFEHIASMGPGEFFGEMALVKGEKRNARVTAKTRLPPRLHDGLGLQDHDRAAPRRRRTHRRRGPRTRGVAESTRRRSSSGNMRPIHRCGTLSPGAR